MAQKMSSLKYDLDYLYEYKKNVDNLFNRWSFKIPEHPIIYILIFLGNYNIAYYIFIYKVDLRFSISFS